MPGVAGMGTPKQIGSPVPGVDIGAALTPQLAPQAPAPLQPAPDMPAQAPSAQPAADMSDLDALFAESGGDAVSQPNAQASDNSDLDKLFAESGGEDSQQEESGFWNGAKHVVQDFATAMVDPQSFIENKDNQTRFKASFAETDKEKRSVLEDAYGPDNVKKAGKDGWLIKQDGKWKKFGGDWSLVGKIADFGGDIVQGLGTEAGTAAGLIGATGEAAVSPATGGISLLAIPGTIAAARAAGGVAGTAAKDLFAQGMGIPRDPERSFIKEAGTNAALNATLGHLGDWALGKLAARSASKATEALQTNETLFKNEIQTVNEAQKVLNDSGLYNGAVEGSNAPLSILEQAPGSPAAKSIFKKVAELPQVQQVIKLKNDAFDGGIRKWLDMVSNFSGEKVEVGQKVGDYVKQTLKSEGKLIGDYRKEFLDAAGDGELPIPKLAAKAKEVADKLGFSVSDDGKSFIRPSVEDLAAQGYSEEGAKNLLSLVEKLNEKIFNNGDRLNAKEILGLYNQYSGLVDNLYARGGSADGAFRRTATDLKNAIRDTLTEKMGVVLDNNEGYKKSLAKFSSIKEGASQIANMIEKDNVPATSLAKYVFSKGASGLDNIKATKAVLADRPDLWNDMVGQYLSDAAEQVTNKGSGKVDWQKFTKNVGGLGDEVLHEMLGKDNKKVLDAFATLGTNLSNISKMSGLTPAATAAINKDIGVGFFKGSYNAAGNAALKLLGGFDTDKALFSALQKDGVESFLKTAPKAQKPYLKALYQGYLDFQNSILSNRPALGAVRQMSEDKMAYPPPQK